MYSSSNRSILRHRSLSLVLTFIISTGLSHVSFATDFQMPPSVAAGGSEGSASKKSLVSKGTYNLLVDVQGSIDEGDIDGAFEKLNRLIIRVQKNAYETAVVLKTAGYIYVSRNENTKAIELLELAHNMSALVHENQQKLRYDLSQLYLSEDQLMLSIRYLQSWLEHAKKDELNAAVFIRLGNAYMQAKEYQEAVKSFERAVAQSETPVEYHLQLLLASYVIQKDYGKGIQLLKRIVTLYPGKKKYVLQLTGLYDELEQEDNALGALEYAYKNQLLNETQELSDLAYRLITRGYPHKAAEVLEAGFKDFILWYTAENYSLLAKAHLDAKQVDRAIPYLEKAILTATTPNSAQALSHAYIEMEDYENAARALQIGLKRSSKDQQRYLNLSLGHVLFKLGRNEQALAVYRRLKDDVSLDEQAKVLVNRWYRYLNSL